MSASSDDPVAAPGGGGFLGLPASLFTHEDPANLHKLFGLACLLHYAYRLACVPLSLLAGETADLMRFGRASAHLPALLLMHSALSLLSLVFHLPDRRIKTGTRIWPEFRLHSIVFAHRSLACMALVWADEKWPAPDGQPRYWANALVVFATLAAADAASASVPRERRSPTVRGFETDAALRSFFTTVQFLGTTNALFGLRSHANYFMTVLVIQTTAFLFTLQRKNIISHRAALGWYAFLLVFGIAVGVTDCVHWAGADGLFIFAAVAAAAQTLRVRGVNKYAVWAAVAALVPYARRTTSIVPPALRYAWWPYWGWPALYVAANVLVNVAAPAARAPQQQQQQQQQQGGPDGRAEREAAPLEAAPLEAAPPAASKAD